MWVDLYPISADIPPPPPPIDIKPRTPKKSVDHRSSGEIVIHHIIRLEESGDLLAVVVKSAKHFV